jgi:hypothetical protein
VVTPTPTPTDQVEHPRKLAEWLMSIGKRNWLLLLAMMLIAAGAPFWLGKEAVTGEGYITNPRDGDTVPWRISIEGKAQGLSRGSSLWVVLYSASDRRYSPHYAPTTQKQDGGFVQTDVLVGDEGDTGKPFTLYLLAANHDGRSLLLDYLHDVGRGPLCQLPQGIRKLFEVQVVRAGVLIPGHPVCALFPIDDGAWSRFSKVISVLGTILALFEFVRKVLRSVRRRRLETASSN